MSYYAGIDCRCNASVERDCSCADVDWTPTEVYKLRTGVAELRKQLAQAQKQLATANKEIERLKHFDSAINIILDAKDCQNPIFVEIENDSGKSISIGKKTETEWGLTNLRITNADIINNILIYNSRNR